MTCIRIGHLGNIGGYQSSGGSRGSLEGGCGVVGGGHHQLCPKRGKLLADIGVAYMVSCWCVRSPK